MAIVITPTYENVQLAQRLAPLIRAWLDGKTARQRTLFAMATSGNYRTYTAMAKDLRLSVTRVTQLMNRLRRGGTVVLHDGLKDAGLPGVDYDVTACPWGTLVALRVILHVADAHDSHRQTQ